MKFITENWFVPQCHPLHLFPMPDVSATLALGHPHFCSSKRAVDSCLFPALLLLVGFCPVQSLVIAFQ